MTLTLTMAQTAISDILLSPVFSRSQNTSSESTPRHHLSSTHHRRHQGGVARSRGHTSPVMLQEPPDKMETKIVVTNTNRRGPIVKL